jgi:hypothetical protein
VQPFQRFGVTPLQIVNHQEESGGLREKGIHQSLEQSLPLPAFAQWFRAGQVRTLNEESWL